MMIVRLQNYLIKWIGDVVVAAKVCSFLQRTIPLILANANEAFPNCFVEPHFGFSGRGTTRPRSTGDAEDSFVGLGPGSGYE